MKTALIALALLPLLTRAAAAQTSDFEALLNTGFKEVRDSPQSAGAPAPSSQAPAAAPFAAGGVFVHSSRDGRIAYCSAAGCRVLIDGAGVVALAGPGALYFSGPIGTGYCVASGCRDYLPGVRVTFPLTSGPKGDIYGSDDKAGWHCTPDACRQASSVPLQRYTNYIQGIYKPSGDFLSSGADGTFWCSNGDCRLIGRNDMLFIDGSCAGNGPAQAAYAFAGSYLYRCTPAGCREIGVDDNVDNFVDCAFDEKERLLLPVRDDQGRSVKGSILCSEDGVVRSARDVSSIPAAARTAAPARSSEFFLTGEDGATYRLANHAADGRPDAGAPRTYAAAVSRTDAAGRASVLAFDVPVACWQWSDGDQDEDPATWDGDCRVIR